MALFAYVKAGTSYAPGAADYPKRACRMSAWRNAS